MENKKTMVIGASINTTRYSYLAVEKLKKYGHTVVPIGIKAGEIFGEKIITGMPQVDNIHTVSLYVSSKNQLSYYTYIINLKPQRVIFNPGTENFEFENKLRLVGIEAIEACTLVMLSTGEY